MNIVVCVKQVPAKDAPLTIAGNWIKESDWLQMMKLATLEE